jgi:hypothetical protein
MRHLGPILGYAAIAATVGLVLQIIKERAGILGRILAGLGGLAWNLATYLVIPVLITQGIGPIEAIQESARIFKRTWGEQIAGTIGIGLCVGVAVIVYSLLAIPLIVVTAIAKAPLALLLIIIGLVVLGYVLLALAGSTLKGIYSAALYRFATTGDAGMFDRRLLDRWGTDTH